MARVFPAQRRAADDARPPAEPAPRAGPGTLVASCRSLEDQPVVNHEDEELGRIARILVEPATGRVSHAVIASGGVLGIGERLCTVPWGVLASDPERRCFVADIDPAILLGARRQ